MAHGKHSTWYAIVPHKWQISHGSLLPWLYSHSHPLFISCAWLQGLSTVWEVFFDHVAKLYYNTIFFWWYFVEVITIFHTIYHVHGERVKIRLKILICKHSVIMVAQITRTIKLQFYFKLWSSTVNLIARMMLHVNTVIFNDLNDSLSCSSPGVVAIEPEWLPHLLPHLCTFSKPQAGSELCHTPSGTVRCLRTCTFGE